MVANARAIEPFTDPDVVTVEGDIAKPATADRIVEGALERFGRIDTLVDNAGVFVSKSFTDYTAEDYARVTGVNLTGFFWLTQRVIAEIVRRYGGHVVTSRPPLRAGWPRPPGHWPSSTPRAASGSTPSRRGDPACRRGQTAGR